SGAAWLTSKAIAQGLSQVGPVFTIGVMPEVFDILTTAFTYDIVSPSDSGAFDEAVVDQNGNMTMASSRTAIDIIALSAGLRTPVLGIYDWPYGRWAGAFAYARAGYAWISGDRGISDCGSCGGTTFQ